ncbi:MAG: ECF transporter S component [Oscillospiraceae bacterium]
MKKTSQKTLALIQLSLFGAIIIVLAFTPFIGYIPLGVTRATIIHIPVIVGSILLGPKKGAILGTLFGITSLIQNTISPTVTSFVFSPFYGVGEGDGSLWSLVVCFVPRILVGIVPFYIYQLMKKWTKNRKGSETLSLTLAGLVGSMTNTLLVMNLIYFLFGESYAVAKEIPLSTLYTVILSVIGINGVPEAILAALLTAAICKALLGVRKKTPLFYSNHKSHCNSSVTIRRRT